MKLWKKDALSWTGVIAFWTAEFFVLGSIFY
jgi:hypothetical protein